jgi:hypothetical protein
MWMWRTQRKPQFHLAYPACPHSQTEQGRVPIATNPPRIRRSPNRLYQPASGNVQSGRGSNDLNSPPQFHDPNDLLSPEDAASTAHRSVRSVPISDIRRPGSPARSKDVSHHFGQAAALTMIAESFSLVLLPDRDVGTSACTNAALLRLSGSVGVRGGLVIFARYVRH